MDENVICERGVDVVSYLYGETDERETREIEMHLRECGSCQAEAAAIGQVRQSVVAWRDEVLTGFIPSTVAVPVKRSALAAFRQFFDLSPLWLKAATAFAAVVFCVLAISLWKKEKVVPFKAKGYTQEQVDQLINEALAKQQIQPRIEEKVAEPIVAVTPLPRKKQIDHGRRPLSRAERAQLAADLRLVPANDEVELLGDRISQ
ncbi:MAG TPA: zf-HC2 domain-containing protein [Pyrinomonadaceae bacterium]|nr:zf-HC2 domain-containing protein [Pyrinomonadaceae bacterium]